MSGSVLWFRHGLRLHDNPALHAGIGNKKAPFYPIFIFDGETAGTKLAGYNRMRYLLESLGDLDKQFRKHGGKLLMFRNKNPEQVIRRLWEELCVTHLTFEQDCEPLWTNRDNKVKKLCYEVGILCSEHVSHTLWNPYEVIRANGGIPPLTYEMFLHTVSTINDPPRPVADVNFENVTFGLIPSYLAEELQMLNQLPTPEDFGIFPENDNIRINRWIGGETVALEHLQKRLEVEHDAFRKGIYLPTHSSPDLVGPPVSLSPALRFGCLSVRRFYWTIQDMFSDIHGQAFDTTPHITGQLIWREYFYTMSVDNPNYGQMDGNPICLDIPWKEFNKTEFEKWCCGETGFPFVDAAMRQLRTEGWMHHVVRNTVASFLTRGTLWMSWEHGLQHFLKYLLDADWSVCAGNWMWVSSSAFEALLDSSACACPIRLGQRLDPSGEYVKRYVPELRTIPIKYIYEPWEMTLDEQQKWGCIIGRDYPNRIVNLKETASRNRLAMETLRITLQKAPPHCCPSSMEEIRQFMWLPEGFDEIEMQA